MPFTQTFPKTQKEVGAYTTLYLKYYYQGPSSIYPYKDILYGQAILANLHHCPLSLIKLSVYSLKMLLLRSLTLYILQALFYTDNTSNIFPSITFYVWTLGRQGTEIPP